MRKNKIDLLEMFGLRGPLIVAPMGGGPTTPELVAATCNAGALGTLAAAYLTPDQINASVEKVRALTKRPFAINLFTPMPEVSISNETLTSALNATRIYRQELGLQDPVLKPPYHAQFEGQFNSVLNARPNVFSFVFGVLDKYYLSECRKLKIFVVGTATTVDEALQLEETGVDAIIAQGVEAGAHRGIFSEKIDDPGVGTLELSRQVSSRVQVPVIAAGGLMTGKEIVETLKAGAQCAMLGTAFLLCPEAGTSEAYRLALLGKSDGGRTTLTRAFSGRLARGIENRFMKDMEGSLAILPFPAQNAFTRDIRNAATKAKRPEYLSLWAGTGLSKIRQMKAAELVEVLFKEIQDAGFARK